MSEVARGAKSEAIRQIIGKYPGLTAKKICLKVKEEFNIDVEPSNVYPIINNPRSLPEPSVDQISNIMPVVQEVGGFEEAQKALYKARKLLSASGDDLDLAIKLCHLAEKMSVLFNPSVVAEAA